MQKGQPIKLVWKRKKQQKNKCKIKGSFAYLALLLFSSNYPNYKQPG
jgi:hypothetical protein